VVALRERYPGSRFIRVLFRILAVPLALFAGGIVGGPAIYAMSGSYELAALGAVGGASFALWELWKK